MVFLVVFFAEFLCFNKIHPLKKLKEIAIKQYAEQKRVVQILVYDAIQKHKDKITKGIKPDNGIAERNRGIVLIDLIAKKNRKHKCTL